jgi:hypothetical protein
MLCCFNLVNYLVFYFPYFLMFFNAVFMKMMMERMVSRIEERVMKWYHPLHSSFLVNADLIEEMIER